MHSKSYLILMKFQKRHATDGIGQIGRYTLLKPTHNFTTMKSYLQVLNAKSSSVFLRVFYLI